MLSRLCLAKYGGGLPPCCQSELINIPPARRALTGSTDAGWPGRPSGSARPRLLQRTRRIQPLPRLLCSLRMKLAVARSLTGHRLAATLRVPAGRSHRVETASHAVWHADSTTTSATVPGPGSRSRATRHPPRRRAFARPRVRRRVDTRYCASFSCFNAASDACAPVAALRSSGGYRGIKGDHNAGSLSRS